jgi:hypothetical protein
MTNVDDPASKTIKPVTINLTLPADIKASLLKKREAVSAAIAAGRAKVSIKPDDSDVNALSMLYDDLIGNYVRSGGKVEYDLGPRSRYGS